MKQHNTTIALLYCIYSVRRRQHAECSAATRHRAAWSSPPKARISLTDQVSTLTFGAIRQLPVLQVQLGLKFGVLAPKIEPYYNKVVLAMPVSSRNSNMTYAWGVKMVTGQPHVPLCSHCV